MVWKSVILVSLYVLPYLAMVLGFITNPWLLLLCWIVMGWAGAGIGFSIMHDANHGAYSSNRKTNRILGSVINLLGASAENWKVQHNVLHHTYANVEGHDEDIDPGPLMKLSPHAKYYSFHRFQHIYGWFLYSLMTFLWLTTKDFRQLNRYRNMGLTSEKDFKYSHQLTRLILGKIFYYIVFLVIPIMSLPVAWWVTVLYFIVFQLVIGFLLGIVFQPAHVMPNTNYPLPTGSGQIETDWAAHQLYTTTDFAPTNKLLSWYVGGLNFQVIHHLFPNICHVHYKPLSKIVGDTAAEFGLPYNTIPTYRQALSMHGEFLKELGKPQA